MIEAAKQECKNGAGQACVPFYLHENAMMHKDRDNRRMMVVCLSLCITLIVVVVTLVAYYTSRTAMWNETISQLNRTIVEVTNGKGSS